MVLVEETAGELTFRFKGQAWAAATVVPGLALLGVVGWLFRSGYAQRYLLVILGLFGMALLYSSFYSLTASQWLRAGGERRSLRFHKKNLYGLVDWERPAAEFHCVRVGRSLRSSSWHITLIPLEGAELELGENAFGSYTLEGALALATKLSLRTGVPVVGPSERF
jgi:hypothetical protein